CAGLLEGLLAPGVPVHRVVGVLEEVRAGLAGQAVREALRVHRTQSGRLERVRPPPGPGTGNPRLGLSAYGPPPPFGLGTTDDAGYDDFPPAQTLLFDSANVTRAGSGNVSDITRSACRGSRRAGDGHHGAWPKCCTSVTPWRCT